MIIGSAPKTSYSTYKIQFTLCSPVCCEVQEYLKIFKISKTFSSERQCGDHDYIWKGPNPNQSTHPIHTSTEYKDLVLKVTLQLKKLGN